MSDEELNEKIENGEFTLYDKFLYGGIGYGYICLAKNAMRVILSVLFPPLGIILHHLQLKDTFPYITRDGLVNLVDNLNDVMFSVFLTFLFWVPGVVYSLKQIKAIGEDEKNAEEFASEYGIHPDELTEEMVKEFMKDIKKRKKYSV
jgi:uncharacterized membrane protein YqaE (UPF0057 family)